MSNAVMYQIIPRYHIEYSRSEFHDAKGVLEPLMCGSWIHHIFHSELVDVSQSLYWPRIQYISLYGVQPNEHMYGVPDLVV